MATGRVLSAAVCVCLLATVGCAARHTPLSGRFVKQGEPSISYDLPGTTTAQVQVELTPAQRREIAAHTTRQSSGHTVEATNRELSEALRNASVKQSADAFHLVAEAYRRLGIVDKAYDYLNLAIAKNPRSAALLEQRAQIWRDWNYPHLALPDAHSAVYRAPRSASAHSTLGTILQAIGDLSNARKAFEKAFALDGGAAYVLSNLCYLSVLEGYQHRAEGECRKALALMPDLTAARHNLALSYAATGDLVRARAEFLITGDSATADFNIGVIHMASRHYGLAADAFRAASNARPTFTQAATQARRAQSLAEASGQTYEQSRAH